MVASSSAASHAADNEKRKKQTMEKVKVNHLSRQLQMRLQYARLKVENGWQKQNLNEVENLYFHNSYLRGSKSHTGPTMAAAQSQSSSAFLSPQMSFAQSRSSFRFGSTPVHGSSSSVGSLLNTDQNGHNSTQGESSFPHASQESTATTSTSTINTHPSIGVNMSDAQSTSAPPKSMCSTPSVTPSVPYTASSSNENASKSPDDPAGSIPESTGSPHGSQSPIDITQNIANYYPATKNVLSRPNKVLPASRSQLSLTAKDMYNFGTSSPLTYDSFWSAHSGSNTPRATRSPLGLPSAEFHSAFQATGDFTSSGVQDNLRTMSTSILSRASTFGSAALQLEAARNPTGPT